MMYILADQIKFELGLRHHEHNGIIGYGHKVNGTHAPDRITERDADLLLFNDLCDTENALVREWHTLTMFTNPGPRHDACIDLAFAWGVPGFVKFKDFTQALARFDFDIAETLLLSGEWAREFPHRAKRIGKQLISDRYCMIGSCSNPVK